MDHEVTKNGEEGRDNLSVIAKKKVEQRERERERVQRKRGWSFVEVVLKRVML